MKLISTVFTSSLLAVGLFALVGCASPSSADTRMSVRILGEWVLDPKATGEFMEAEFARLSSLDREELLELGGERLARIAEQEPEDLRKEAAMGRRVVQSLDWRMFIRADSLEIGDRGEPPHVLSTEIARESEDRLVVIGETQGSRVEMELSFPLENRLRVRVIGGGDSDFFLWRQAGDDDESGPEVSTAEVVIEAVQLGLEGAAVEGPASGAGQVDDLQGSLGTDAEIETEPAGPGTAPRTIDDRDEAKELQTRHGYGPADGATFKVLRVSALDKANELDGVERDDFSSLSQEEWEHLPMLLELHFEFLPTQGNTTDLEDTFLLTPADMAVLVGGRSFASIGTISQHGERELHQRMPLNVAGEEYPDGRLDYCGMGCPQSTMWFLVPEGTEEIELVYRETPIAAGKAE